MLTKFFSVLLCEVRESQTSNPNHVYRCVHSEGSRRFSIFHFFIEPSVPNGTWKLSDGKWKMTNILRNQIAPKPPFPLT